MSVFFFDNIKQFYFLFSILASYKAFLWAYGSLVVGLWPVTEKSLVQNPLWFFWSFCIYNWSFALHSVYFSFQICLLNLILKKSCIFMLRFIFFEFDSNLRFELLIKWFNMYNTSLVGNRGLKKITVIRKWKKINS